MSAVASIPSHLCQACGVNRVSMIRSWEFCGGCLDDPPVKPQDVTKVHESPAEWSQDVRNALKALSVDWDTGEGHESFPPQERLCFSCNVSPPTRAAEQLVAAKMWEQGSVAAVVSVEARPAGSSVRFARIDYTIICDGCTAGLNREAEGRIVEKLMQERNFSLATEDDKALPYKVCVVSAQG